MFFLLTLLVWNGVANATDESIKVVDSSSCLAQDIG